MARTATDTVDYFPHQCLHKRTMDVLEQRFGNDGYAFWFKLLERLGASPGHYLDLRDPLEREYLFARARVDETTGTAILSLLARTNAIDSNLAEIGVIWCQNFVENLIPVYANRKRPLPQKPGFLPVEIEQGTDNYCRNATSTPVSTVEMRQSRVEKSIGEQSKSPRLRGAALGAPIESPPPEDEESEHGTDTEPSLDDIQNANALMDAVNAIEPGYTKRARVNFDKWSDEFRLIRTRDHRTQQEIEFVIHEFHRHEFWSRNIRSPGSLRGRTKSGADKFLKILADLRTKPTNGATNGRAKNNAMPDPDSSRAVLAHFGVE